MQHITKTSVTLYWTSPQDDGGCSVTSYAILRDGGPGDSTFVEVHGTSVNNDPTMHTFTVTDLPAGMIGLPVNFKVRASNLGGFSTTSPSSSAIIADVPAKPTAPIVVPAETSATQITIQLIAPDNGGATLLGYDVEMDDGLGGGFSQISSDLITVTRVTVTSVSNHIKKGLAYRFKYRAKNVIGFGEYSDTFSFLAASVPDAP